MNAAQVVAAPKEKLIRFSPRRSANPITKIGGKIGSHIGNRSGSKLPNPLFLKPDYPTFGA
jgi:hypothetical protein